VTLSSAQRKLARGVEQIKTLEAETGAFVQSEAYVFDTKRERRAPNQIACQCFATERHAPPDHWPLLAGEIIQNLRSALDHSVWAAWDAVDSNTGDGDHTQFVLCNRPADFNKRGWRLEGIPCAVQAVVKRSQPYERFPQAPARDTLAILGALSNADKHRALRTVASVVSLEYIGADNGVKIEEWDVASGKPLGHGTAPISAFLATSDTHLDEMSVSPHFTYGIRVEGVPLAYFHGLVHCIFEIVTEIETGSTPHPFATYPI
jgi:hypothetical protein